MTTLTKRKNNIPKYLGILVFAIILTSCSGGLLGNSNWPGISVKDETIFISLGQYVHAVDVDSGGETCRFPRESDFEQGMRLRCTGKVREYRGLQFVAPELDKADGEEGMMGILPRYPLTEGISQRMLRRIVKGALERYAPHVPEILDVDLLRRRKMPPRSSALHAIHFPESIDEAKQAKRRLAYEEFFLLELGMAMRKRGIKDPEKGYAFRITSEIDRRIRKRIPFKLTAAQERVIAEVREDMTSPTPMNRMLQGDVGSGKTAVALYALLAAIADKFQAAIMAPTEILAEQHYLTFRRYLAGSKVRMALLAGGRGSRRKNLEMVRKGEVDLVIGTHALIEKDVQFKRLGLVVVDEQHKFGVIQRRNLRQKGRHPDVLVMTATPIPRTLTLTVFGDLDFSVLDEMPPRRGGVKTRWATNDKLEQAYEFIREKLQEGQQAFMIYPLVEESDKLDLKNATERAEFFQRKVFPDFKVGLLHGRMSADVKDEVMADFRSRKYNVLVATVVVEVGIDIPNATVMLVEHADRFGLAQLHQLRGRIGRGEKTSYFLPFADPRSDEARKRLEVIASTSDGFRIAEEDLRLRGPGEFFGTRQHGLPELRVGDIVADYPLLRMARKDAFELVAADPELRDPKHVNLREALMRKFKDRLELINVG